MSLAIYYHAGSKVFAAVSEVKTCENGVEGHFS